MNKMQDGEVRRMAVFKLRQVARQLAELEVCTEDASTRACLAAVRAVLRSATEDLLNPSGVVVEGEDETRLVVR